MKNQRIPFLNDFTLLVKIKTRYFILNEFLHFFPIKIFLIKQLLLIASSFWNLAESLLERIGKTHYQHFGQACRI